MNQTNSPAGFYQNQVQPQQQIPVQATNQPQVPTQQPTIPGMHPTILPQNTNIPLNPNINQNSPFQTDSDIINDGLIDPILKCKDLYTQLKHSLQLLLSQLALVLNPSTEISRVQTENQYQLLGKYVENFNRVCDLLVVNLRVACEAQTISNDFKMMNRYFIHYGSVNPNRQETTLSSFISGQMQGINDFRMTLQRFLSSNNSINQQQVSNENPTLN